MTAAALSGCWNTSDWARSCVNLVSIGSTLRLAQKAPCLRFSYPCASLGSFYARLCSNPQGPSLAFVSRITMAELKKTPGGTISSVHDGRLADRKQGAFTKDPPSRST